MQSKGTRISSRKQDDFVGLRSIRSSTSGRWLEKSGKHDGPNFTMKPNTKARSLQFCKTEIKTDIGGEKKRNKRRIYGRQLQNTGHRSQVTGQVTGHRAQGTGYRAQGTGHRAQKMQ